VSRRVARVPLLLVLIPSALVVLAALLLDGLGFAGKALGVGLILAAALPAVALVRAGMSPDRE